MIASFFLSGLLHEIAISFPVNSGYGLPLLYFVIHGVLMYLEGKSALIKKIIEHKILSHFWVLGWLVLPMPLLFHTNFVNYVLKPLRSGIVDMF
jgi:alginate O-acetyltransferase complex protein AlgI